MHHAGNNHWTNSKSSCLGEPVTLSPVTKEQVQATTTKNTILGNIPLIRGCLLFDALAQPQHLQVKSKAQKQFLMASHNKDAHRMF
jgi:hypothetical protein